MGVQGKYTASFIALAACASSAPAQAETLRLGAHLPAGTDAALDVEAIAVDDLGGSKGSQLAFELKEVLQKARVHDEPWFDVIAIGAGPVDAVIQGGANVDASVIELEPKRERKCDEKDDDGKCIRYRTDVYECTRTEVTFYPDIEVVGQKGRLLYASRDAISREKEICADFGPPPSIREMTDGLVGSFAWRVRNALAPRYYERDYRILERRKGLEKADRKAFKAAVKLTKSDEDAACEAFKALEVNNPTQVSVLFNSAMCHERAGDFDASLAVLERALAVEPKKLMALESVDRVEGWIKAEEQLAKRADILTQRYAAALAAQPTPQSEEGALSAAAPDQTETN
ncbi:MAG: hypothetical protein AAGK17_13560 [Pseudomonadota bacterium]